jgi:hypothetical protein
MSSKFNSIELFLPLHPQTHQKNSLISSIPKKDSMKNKIPIMVANTFPKKSHNYIFLISRKTNEMLQIKKQENQV